MQLAAEVSFWYLSFTLWILCRLFLACLPFIGDKEDVVLQVPLPPVRIHPGG